MNGYNTKNKAFWDEIKNVDQAGANPYVDGL